VASLIALAALCGCGGGQSAPVVTPPAPASKPFASVVFLGDSVTAGFQNGSLLDTQQPNGFASLIATQAGFAITLPLIGAPGEPSVLTLEALGFPPTLGQAPGTTAGRDNPTAQPTDLGVPGYTVDNLIYTQPTAAPSSSEDIFTELVLGYPEGSTNSELEEAIALNPSTIFLWIGGNDALGADESGTPSAMTPLTSFTTDYTLLLSTLKSKTTAHLFVANIPDITLIPYMTPAAEVIAAAASATGLTSTAVSAQLGISAGDLVNSTGLVDADVEVTAFTPGSALSTLPAADVLSAADIVVVQAIINSYNQVIAQQVSAAGGTLVDLHAFYATLAAGMTIGGYNSSTAYLGGLFGLDGIHPTNTGYALIANQYIAAINTALGLTVPTVNVAEVAASDPYFGANIKPLGDSARWRMRLLAARKANLSSTNRRRGDRAVAARTAGARLS
jgi:phospholipase/lecithinase/hemolysin